MAKVTSTTSRSGGRLLRVATGAAVFLTVLSLARPSDSAIQEAALRPPSAQQVETLLALSDWLLGESAAGEFHAFSEADLVTAIRAEPASFELFRGSRETATQEWLEEKVPYGRLIWGSARRHELDGLLLASIVETESGFDPQARSPSGARGLMQVLPSTGAQFGATNLFNPADNVEAGARYFSRLLERYDDDVVLALAAYNAGPGSVQRWDGVPPYRETRHYVKRVLSRYISQYRQLSSETETG